MPKPQDAVIRALLDQMFKAAIASADPARTLAPHLPPKPKGRVVVVGAGKAAAAMARALEAAWPDVDLAGVVVTRHGHGVPTARIEVLEAGHPVPDRRSVAAARRILASVRGLSSDDLVVALISGGGSALMTLPAEGLTLQDKITTNRLLLGSGAPIATINKVRRRLSAIKGGRLAQAAAPANVVTLAISDIPGDDPCDIASGPTVYDRDRAADLTAIVSQLGAALPLTVRRLLLAPPPAQAPFDSDYRLIATPFKALTAAAATARTAGLAPLVLGDALEGEARQVAIVLAGIARCVCWHGQPCAGPAVLLSGGETTVTLRHNSPGQGGRNTEFLLSLALALQGEKNIYALAGDTDGIDGTQDAAGAIVTPDTLARAAAAGIDLQARLACHDSYSVFQSLGDLVKTGPTLTNVNDFRAIVIL